MTPIFPLALSLLVAGASADEFSLTLESPTPINRVGATYSSFNIDPSCNRGFHKTNFSNPNLVAAARGLYPSRLRFGGSGADALYYGLTPGSPECGAYVNPTQCFEDPDYLTPGCLNTSHLSTIYNLANGSGSELLFGISYDLDKACKAGNAYVWDSAPATALLKYFAVQSMKVWGVELGNEISNSDNTTACRQLPSSQAEAFNTLAGLVADILPGTHLVGPDSGGNNPLQWLQGFLPLVKPGVLTGITHHVYNGLERRNWNSPKQLDLPITGGEVGWYTNVTSLYPSAGVWAGENGPIGGGNSGTCGTNSTCGTYSSSIWYSDDMALRAKHGFTHYQRQDLFGGAYGLTASLTGDMALGDEEAIALAPDYWVGFLWKRCLGREVYNLTASSSNIRAYAFSGPPPSPFSPPQCASGGLQLLLLNLDDDAAGGNATTPSLPAFGGMDSWAAWTLTPATPGDGGGVFGKRVAVNGVERVGVVDVQGGGVNPASFLSTIGVEPQVGTLSQGLTLPPASSTFVCYH